MIYFSSDFHFNHNREFIYNARGFDSIQEHDNAIIDNINDIVRENDDLYFLGDFGLGSDDDYLVRCMERINCNIKFVRGNHDSDKRVDAYGSCRNFEYLGYADTVKDGKWEFFLCHYPAAVNPEDTDHFRKPKHFCLCGHTHTKYDCVDMSIGAYNVGIDAHMRPISIEEVKYCISFYKNC